MLSCPFRVSTGKFSTFPSTIRRTVWMLGLKTTVRPGCPMAEHTVMRQKSRRVNGCFITYIRMEATIGRAVDVEQKYIFLSVQALVVVEKL